MYPLAILLIMGLEAMGLD
ncbi:hypothetical protein KIPB_012553, partial [Kipferlia bialata]|eukprot:g12553.t1